MFSKYFVCSLVLCLITIVSIQVSAVTRKKPKTYIRLIEAYYQRTLPGIPGEPIKTSYHFVIRWEGAKYPETFFWRGESGWLTCNTERARKLVSNGKVKADIQYKTEEVGGDQVHKGDTLILTPVSGGKFPIPDEIPQNAKNTLFFKTGGSGWLSFPVKNIKKRKDIAMQ